MKHFTLKKKQTMKVLIISSIKIDVLHGIEEKKCAWQGHLHRIVCVVINAYYIVNVINKKVFTKIASFLFLSKRDLSSDKCCVLFTVFSAKSHRQ